VESARRHGFEGAIILVGAEEHLPYDRPPLSKDFLKADGGTPDFFVSERELEDHLNIDVRLGVRATGLDTANRTVRLSDDSTVTFERLIIATGTAPRLIPNLPVDPRIHVLRTLDDAARLRSSLQGARRVVTIGAGFIGSEIASSAAELGSDVWIVEAADVPLVRAVGIEIGKALSELHPRHGTTLLCGQPLTGVEATPDAVVLTLGTGEQLLADAVVVGIGSAPATAWLEESGLNLHERDRGVICDEFLETSVPGIFAAGDVVHWPNSVMGDVMRLENWTNAADQGDRAARNAVSVNERLPFETVPYFWSDWYGHRIQFVGTGDADEVVFVSGSAGEDKFVALLRRGDRLIGAATLNEPRKIMKIRRLIALRCSWEQALDELRLPVRA